MSTCGLSRRTSSSCFNSDEISCLYTSYCDVAREMPNTIFAQNKNLLIEENFRNELSNDRNNTFYKKLLAIPLYWQIVNARCPALFTAMTALALRPVFRNPSGKLTAGHIEDIMVQLSDALSELKNTYQYIGSFMIDGDIVHDRLHGIDKLANTSYLATLNEKQIPWGGIINTASIHDAQGQHWVALTIYPQNPENKHLVIEYFDSFGFPPKKKMMKSLERFVKRSSLNEKESEKELSYEVIYHDVRMQEDTSVNCGFYVLYYIAARAGLLAPEWTRPFVALPAISETNIVKFRNIIFDSTSLINAEL
jgi:hypothetical protein